MQMDLVGFVEDELFINAQIENIANIDDIPFPAFHMLPMENTLRLTFLFLLYHKEKEFFRC
jgi:hypothetical protein